MTARQYVTAGRGGVQQWQQCFQTNRIRQQEERERMWELERRRAERLSLRVKWRFPERLTVGLGGDYCKWATFFICCRLWRQDMPAELLLYILQVDRFQRQTQLPYFIPLPVARKERTSDYLLRSRKHDYKKWDYKTAIPMLDVVRELDKMYGREDPKTWWVGGDYTPAGLSDYYGEYDLVIVEAKEYER